jgi:hypothetical protein
MRLSIAVVALVLGFSLAGCFEGPQGPQGLAGPHARGFKTRYDVRSRRLMFDVGRTVARPRDCPLRRQSGFRETLGKPPNVLFLLERLPGEMFAEGVFWIDLFEFFPDAASLIAVTEMTKS